MKKISLLIFLVTVIFSIEGCAAFKGLTEKPVGDETIVRSISRVDSIAAAGLPADTIALERNLLERESYLSADEKYRGASAVSRESGAKESFYSVQIASAEKSTIIDQAAQKARREFGESTSVVRVGGQYCLRIGNYKDKADAEALRKIAVSYGYEYAWIVQTYLNRY